MRCSSRARDRLSPLPKTDSVAQGSDDDSGDESPDEGDEGAPSGGDGEDSQDEGSQSSEREVGDWYDVDDDFIDDSELVDVPGDSGKAKREGFFINKVRRQAVLPYQTAAQRSCCAG